MPDFWSGKSVLVTGAGGFIASHLVETLVTKGAQVRAFVRYNSRNDPGLLALLPKPVLEQVEIVPGDLRDYPAVLSVIRANDIIFHLGALIAIPYSYRHPREVVETNVIGTLNVLMAAYTNDVSRLIHTSSSEVYGTAQHVPIDESHPLQGQSPYAASKIGADKLAESFYCSYNLPVVTLRPFNTYGPRQSARAVIPTIITQALTRAVVKLGNLDARRDLTYVTDTIEGFLKIAQVPGIEGNTYNLGSGSDIRIGDLAQMIIDLIGKPVEITTDPKRIRPEKSEVQRLIADPSNAHNDLGWEAQVALEDGLIKTIQWITSHIDRYKPEIYQI